MKLITTTLVVGALLLAIIGAANADTTKTPWSVAIGAAWPSQSAAKTAEGDTMFSAGLDYVFAKSKAVLPLSTSVYYDFAGASKNGENLYSDAVGIAVRQPFGRCTTGCATSPYVGAGIGAYMVDDKVAGNSKTETDLGGKVMLGIDFSKMWFLELNYNWAPISQGLNASNTGLQVGLHF